MKTLKNITTKELTARTSLVSFWLSCNLTTCENLGFFASTNFKLVSLKELSEYASMSSPRVHMDFLPLPRGTRSSIAKLISFSLGHWLARLFCSLAVLLFSSVRVSNSLSSSSAVVRSQAETWSLSATTQVLVVGPA